MMYLDLDLEEAGLPAIPLGGWDMRGWDMRDCTLSAPLYALVLLYHLYIQFSVPTHSYIYIYIYVSIILTTTSPFCRCASGPLSLFLSRQTDNNGYNIGDNNGYNKGDIGLIQYGVIEVLGAVLLGARVSDGVGVDGVGVVLSAIGVQVAVLVSWLYCREEDGKERVV